jgi:phospholipid/cholesterol/gamma-HCH transport system substrate-binding protein
MVQMRTLEISVGAFMALGFIALFFLALQVSNLNTFSNGEGYQITARFDNIGGLKVKAAVSMAGVRVGRVTAISVDGKNYDAVVTMTIVKDFNTIPDDTFAKIYTAGLLGEQYIGLEAGGSETYLEQGGELSMTQSALVLEEIIGQFLFSKAAEGVKKESKSEEVKSE